MRIFLLRLWSRPQCRFKYMSKTLLRNYAMVSGKTLQLNDHRLFKEECYVNGEWVKAKSGKTFEVTGILPRTEISKHDPKHVGLYRPSEWTSHRQMSRVCKRRCRRSYSSRCDCPLVIQDHNCQGASSNAEEVA